MNLRKYFSFAVALGILATLAASAEPAKTFVADARDRQVLDALLTHLRTDAKFDLTSVPTSGAQIVLHLRTPKNTGFLQSKQIHADLGKYTLPDGVERNLWARNSKPGAKPDSFENVAAYFTNGTFSPGIVVADLGDHLTNGPTARPFEETYPKARGWLEAYLPGYSKDGTTAVVRAMAGPWAHAASVTALLEKRDDKWVVKWFHIARYA